jgi:hypothetical protein
MSFEQYANQHGWIIVWTDFEDEDGELRPVCQMGKWDGPPLRGCLTRSRLLSCSRAKASRQAILGVIGRVSLGPLVVRSPS